VKTCVNVATNEILILEGEGGPDNVNYRKEDHGNVSVILNCSRGEIYEALFAATGRYGCGLDKTT
jgi:hypothetical protein